MAYNPFNFFRKNQKILFAVITIFVMFTFVLSFGQGDFFSWFPRWLSAQQSTGEPLVELDGRTVRGSELAQVTEKRNVANGYMTQLFERNMASLARKVDGFTADASKVSPEARSLILAMDREFLNRRFQLQSEADLERLRVFLLQAQVDLQRAKEKQGTKAEDKEAYDTTANWFQGQVTQLALATASKRGEGRLYFANMPDRTERDKLEYLLWLKKADQLGIRYTDEDVTAMVDREFPGVSEADRAKVLADARSDKRTPPGVLFAALADEFRVRAVQTALLGPTQVRFFGGLPSPAPYDLFEFFRKQTDRSRFAYLTVPVEPFLKQVEDQLEKKALAPPDDKELRKIYTDAKGYTPNPSSPRAGIAEPAKAVVQWAEVTGQEAYYGPLAEEKLKKVKAAQKAAATPDAAAVLGGAATRPAAFNDTKYDQYKTTQSEIARLWADKNSNPGLPRTDTNALAAAIGGPVQADAVVTSRLLSRPRSDATAKLADESLAKAQNAGILAAVFGGSFGTGGSLMTAPVLLTETAYTSERERRLLTGIQGFLLPDLPGWPTVVNAIGSELALYAGYPKPLPQAVVQPILDDIAKVELRAKVAEEDIKEFQKKLAEIMKGEDKEAATKQAKEYVAKFIADRGLKTGTTAQPRDMHTIADDPALAPLIPRSGVADELKLLGNQVRKSQFGASFFFTVKSNPLNPRDQQVAPATGTYAPVVFPPGNEQLAPADGTPVTLTWRTEESKVEIPREFNDEAKGKALRAWKLTKARELARQACEEAAKIIRDAGDSPIKVNQNLQEALKSLTSRFPDPAVSSRFKLVEGEQYDVAKLVKQKGFLPEMPSQFRPFNIPQGDVFVYPTQKMLDELLANQDKPVGTTLILADNPETTLYVAAITLKDQETPVEFRRSVYQPGTGLNAQLKQAFGPQLTAAQDTITARYAAEARKSARETAVALLKAEFRYANESPTLDKRAAESGE